MENTKLSEIQKNLFLLSLGEEGSYYYMANNSSVSLAETHSTKQAFSVTGRDGVQCWVGNEVQVALIRHFSQLFQVVRWSAAF